MWQLPENIKDISLDSNCLSYSDLPHEGLEWRCEFGLVTCEPACFVVCPGNCCGGAVEMALEV